MSEEITNDLKHLNTLYIGKRIQHIRKFVLKMSQLEFSEALNTSQANISHLESESRFSETTLKAYIYFIKVGINIEWILMPDNSNISLKKEESII